MKFLIKTRIFELKLEDRLHLGNKNKCRFILYFARFALSLQRNDSLHQVNSPVAVAQKRVCVCAHILQHQSAEARILLAYVGGVCIVLSDIKLHLLLQRSERC